MSEIGKRIAARAAPGRSASRIRRTRDAWHRRHHNGRRATVTPPASSCGARRASTPALAHRRRRRSPHRWCWRSCSDSNAFERAEREQRAGLAASRELMQALRVTSQKLDVAYRPCRARRPRAQEDEENRS